MDSTQEANQFMLFFANATSLPLPHIHTHTHTVRQQTDQKPTASWNEMEWEFIDTAMANPTTTTNQPIQYQNGTWNCLILNFFAQEAKIKKRNSHTHKNIFLFSISGAHISIDWKKNWTQPHRAIKEFQLQMGFIYFHLHILKY